MKKPIALCALLLFAGCVTEEPSRPAGDIAPAGIGGTTLDTQNGSEVLHPDGNPTWNQWWKFIPYSECGGGCCFEPCADSWTTVDEDLEDVDNEIAYIGAASSGATHRLSFADATGNANMTISQIDVVFGRIGFNPDLHPWSQTLTVTPRINGSGIGSDDFQCYQSAECDLEDVTWTATFDNLSLTRAQINTLELDLVATGALRPDIAWLDVHHVEVVLTYTYPVAPVIVSKEISTQIACPTAYVQFTVDSGGTTGKVKYGSTGCSTSEVNTTVIGSTHYASFDVSGLPTKFYWAVEATYQGQTTTGTCVSVKKAQYALEECPPPGWWPF